MLEQYKNKALTNAVEKMKEYYKKYKEIIGSVMYYNITIDRTINYEDVEKIEKFIKDINRTKYSFEISLKFDNCSPVIVNSYIKQSLNDDIIYIDNDSRWQLHAFVNELGISINDLQYIILHSLYYETNIMFEYDKYNNKWYIVNKKIFLINLYESMGDIIDVSNGGPIGNMFNFIEKYSFKIDE